MLSDSTPGRAVEAPGVAGGSLFSAMWRDSAISSTEQIAVCKEQRLSDQTLRQRVRDQDPLLDQRPMIAKQGRRRHRGRECGESVGEIRIAPRRSAGNDACEIRRPGSEPVDDL